MMKVILPTISVVTALWLLSKSIRQRKRSMSKSKSIPQETSPSRDGAPDRGKESRGFDVFLNFRGPDSRHTVADILYNTLTDAGIRVFLDDEEIRKGEVIEGELLGAITNSKIYIPIFSKDYASSKWCLRELAKMIDCWECSSGQEKKVILPIFHDVSVSEDVKLRSQVYTSALQKHKKELGGVVVKPWEDALKEVAKIKGWNLQDHGLCNLANLIKERIFSVIYANEAVSSVPDRLVGIRDQMEDIMRLLQDGAPDVRFVVIHGMGGIGKTTLADAVFKHISSSFQNRCILKDVRRYSSVHDMVKLQKKLLSDTLSLKSIEVPDIDDGISKISKRFSDRKVLIVLDDVDKQNYLKNLAAKSDWFGLGSRIIITTRDIGFLTNKDDKEYFFHEMKEMDQVHTLKLFCRHAFDNDCAPAEYENISSEIVATTGGLPLALEVIGSSLYNQNEETWKCRLDELKEAPYKDVRERLMISYRALEYKQQQIFLDIACFFNDEKMMDPSYFWEACKFYPKSTIKILERRSLIKVNELDEKLWMHDQLRDLGRAIAEPKTQDHENNLEPSRFFSPEVALEAVQKKEVAKGIVAIELAKLDDGCCFVREEFEKAINLKFLQLRGGSFQGDFKDVFIQLKWLSWFGCHLRVEVTNLSFPNLVVLKLSGPQITENWAGWDAIKVAQQLKVVYLIDCNCLRKTPNFSSFLKLERLIFLYCVELEEIDGSINDLGNLNHFEIIYPWAIFHPKYKADLVPISLGGLRSLSVLKLQGAMVSKLHPSIGELTSLVELVISSTNIEEIPFSLENLRKLKILEISFCRVKLLPESIGRLESLIELNLGHVEFAQLPESIGNLKRLKVIKLDGSKIKELPKALGELENLEELHASNCEGMHGELPEEMGRLSHLRILDLNRSPITRMPALPSSLTDLTIIFRSAESSTLPDLSQNTNLVSLSLEEVVSLRYSRPHGAMQPHDENTKIDWLARLSKLENLDLLFTGLIFPPTDLSSLHRLRTLNITCINPRSLTHLPSSLERLVLEDVESPIDWQLLASLKNLCHLRLHKCRLEEVIVDSPVHLHSLSLAHSRSVVRLSNLCYLKELRRLEIMECDSLVDIQGLGELEFLRLLSIEDCGSIQRLPDLLRSTKLEDLIFHYCNSLESIPNINEGASCHLRVRHCKNLPSFGGRYSCTVDGDIVYSSDSEYNKVECEW